MSYSQTAADPEIEEEEEEEEEEEQEKEWTALLVEIPNDIPLSLAKELEMYCWGAGENKIDILLEYISILLDKVGTKKFE